MTPLLVAAGVLVAVGAAVATGARNARVASLGLAAMLAAAPFVAAPLPESLTLGFEVVAGILAAFLVFAAARRVADLDGPPLGLPATLAAAAAGFALGLGATAVAVPRSGPDAALAAGLAALAVAVVPLAITRDLFRLGSALLVLLAAGALIMTAVAGTPAPLTGIAVGIVMVTLAAAVAVVLGPISATGITGTSPTGAGGSPAAIATSSTVAGAASPSPAGVASPDAAPGRRSTSARRRADRR